MAEDPLMTTVRHQGHLLSSNIFRKSIYAQACISLAEIHLTLEICVLLVGHCLFTLLWINTIGYFFSFPCKMNHKNGNIGRRNT